VRCLWTIKDTKMALHAVATDLGSPLIASTKDALVPRSIVSMPSYISAILCLRRLAQIGYAIIGTVAVDVIQLISGPTSMHIKPSKSVARAHLPVNHDLHITKSVGAVVADVAVLTREQPSACIVVQHLA